MTDSGTPDLLIFGTVGRYDKRVFHVVFSFWPIISDNAPFLQFLELDGAVTEIFQIDVAVVVTDGTTDPFGPWRRLRGFPLGLGAGRGF